LNKDQFTQILRSEFGYQSPAKDSFPGQHVPGWLPFIYYFRLVRNLMIASGVARSGGLDNEKWAVFSHNTIKIVESVGARLSITGLKGISHHHGPLVFIANHMSLLETFILPSIALAFNKVTFVIKKELLHYPVLGSIFRALNLIAVSRRNPRQDLKVVLDEGKNFLLNGGFVIIFPQATRSVVFDVEGFNSLGVKLALNAGVPVVPLAIKTDFQGNGKIIKDMGPIDPRKTLYFKFGEPMAVERKGHRTHQRIVEFIAQSLSDWGGEVKRNAEFGIRNAV
jgi:1-acyl-sn-glycerol-3-phosphate acyltransferase